ncbi:uncharacterized protein LOC6612163 [Drosophila sechellia]|uniref:GM11059 n=1 Tax=Drosophila sechellia TaxID=7238 RepID=B4HX58_DROSE|nr:uncharacterized protein LOC6612163 [Drosophila sechellia]EDW52603.1 GM11059 [Drosophila sechellia]
MNKKTEYKLSERDLDIRSDLEFVDSVLKDLQLEVEPQARGVILDLAYTLARDKLVEAQRFAKLANRTKVSVEDLEIANLERTEDLSKRAIHQPVKSLVPSQASLPSPTVSRGLMLPTWRQCQVGTMAELKEKVAETQQPNPMPVPPLNPLTATTTGPGLNSGSNSMLAMGSSSPVPKRSHSHAPPIVAKVNHFDKFALPTILPEKFRKDVRGSAIRCHSTSAIYVTRPYYSAAEAAGGIPSATKKPRKQL